MPILIFSFAIIFVYCWYGKQRGKGIQWRGDLMITLNMSVHLFLPIHFCFHLVATIILSFIVAKFLPDPFAIFFLDLYVWGDEFPVWFLFFVLIICITVYFPIFTLLKFLFSGMYAALQTVVQI